MIFSDIVLSITEQFKTTNRIVPFLVGSPGTAKTSLAKVVNDALGFDHMELFYASLRDTVDLMGTPHNAGECTVWKPPVELYRLRSGRNLLVLDELSDASTPMQNALCGLILERRVNDLKLSDQTYIIATGNRTEDKSGANRIVSKLANRVRFFDMVVSLDDWVTWALDADIDPVIIQFVRFRPNLLNDFDPNRRCNPTPRAWERVNFIPTTLPTGVYFENVAGEVGDGAAAEYTGFRKIYEALPDITTVLMNPSRAEVPDDPAVRYALVGALAHAATKDNFDRVCEYIARMPPEFSVMCVNDVIKLKPETRNTKAFVAWAVKNSGVLL